MCATCPIYHIFLDLVITTKFDIWQRVRIIEIPLCSQLHSIAKNIGFDLGRCMRNFDGFFVFCAFYETVPERCGKKIRSVPFITSLSTASLQYWWPALSGIFCTSSHVPGRYKRDTRAFDWSSTCLPVSNSPPASQYIHRIVRAADIVYS